MTPHRPLRRMLLAALNLVGFRFGGAAIALLTQVLLTHLLPQSEVGVVFMAMSATSIISLIATLGYPSLALTTTARYVALQRTTLLEAFKHLVVRDTVVASVAIVLAVAVAALLPIDPALRTALIFGCLSLFASAMLRFNSVLANSDRRFVLSYTPDFLFRPGLLMVYLASAWAIGLTLGPIHVLWAFTIANTLVAFGQALLLGRRGLQPEWRPSPPGFAGPMRRRALALVMVFAVVAAFSDLVTMVGGLYLPPEDVAVLGISIRLAALAGFITQATQQLVLPDLAEVLVRKANAEVRRLLLRVNLVSLGAILICVAATVVAGPLILKLFGGDYGRGHWPLVLFMVSQTFRAASGLNQHLLSIGGHQGKTASACVFALALLFTLSSLLTPRWGLTGIAIAVVVADAAWAVLLAIQAQRHAGHRGDIAGLIFAR